MNTGMEQSEGRMRMFVQLMEDLTQDGVKTWERLLH